MGGGGTAGRGTGTGWDIEDGCVHSDGSIRESLIMVDVEDE